MHINYTYNSPIVSTEGSDDSPNQTTSSEEEPFVVVSDDKNKPKLAAVDDNIPAEEWF
jgi:hypothetical protein